MKIRTLILLFILISPALAAPAAGPVLEGGFRTCAEALAAGYSGMLIGDPVYHPRLDRDRDGIACEPKR